MSNIIEYNCEINSLSGLLWQDENAENIKGLIELKNQWYQTNHCEFWEGYLTNTFVINTANSFGLQIWAYILDIPIYATTNISPPDYPAFGFDPFALNFFDSNFATDSNNTFNLTVEQRRRILKVRYLQLVSTGNTVKDNEMLASIYGNLIVYKIDNLDMTIEYFISSTVDDAEIDALEQLSILPRATAVQVNFTIF